MDVGSIVNKPSTTTAANGTGTTAQKNAADTQDRFLKLLVAQMKNQDPMNPMDNGQVTSQMAQIQTVSGIGTLNNSVQSLTSQFSQMQALQSVSLVGHDVTVPGSRVNIENGMGTGSFELGSAADHVKLEILGPAGQVVDTIDMGAKSAGQQSFKWPADNIDPANKLSYRITATRGAAAVTATLYSQDRVTAINTNGGKLQLQLQNLGTVDYTSVKAVD
ncbi:flagellar hook capping FlgD N-terminal domain-containing protein [Paucibacter sp. APW11]|uniref:Basal-body rod modification protein FlgD n=1 Tax=Roseateles aquae TaxID=3077235 RepID=A0ABU3PAK3_9BURK|nr:flagellar hook capping FlgD N-terminal domain-containing protein [Paucibacter sp. APW11]MDT8999307.1 flagellar hook capping FlgD N-terminal domain-containing protein [Paucibacter sp. APW11]